MSEKRDDHGPFLNTDRELWRERPGDFYADSIHVTERGGIGINVGGMMFVKPLRHWHELARDAAAAEERGRRRGVEEAAKECELRIASWGRLRDQPTVAARVDEAESLAEIIRCLAPRDSGEDEENRDVLDVEREP